MERVIHGSQRSRCRALARLSRENPSAAIAAARRSLSQDAEPSVRRQAVRLLGTVQARPTSDPVLWAALDDPDEDVRWISATQLAPSGDGRVLRVLLAGLQSDNAARRRMTADGLAQLSASQHAALALLLVDAAFLDELSTRGRLLTAWRPGKR